MGTHAPCQLHSRRDRLSGRTPAQPSVRGPLAIDGESQQSCGPTKAAAATPHSVIIATSRWPIVTMWPSVQPAQPQGFMGCAYA